MASCFFTYIHLLIWISYSVCVVARRFSPNPFIVVREKPLMSTRRTRHIQTHTLGHAPNAGKDV